MEELRILYYTLSFNSLPPCHALSYSLLARTRCVLKHTQTSKSNANSKSKSLFPLLYNPRFKYYFIVKGSSLNIIYYIIIHSLLQKLCFIIYKFISSRSPRKALDELFAYSCNVTCFYMISILLHLPPLFRKFSSSLFLALLGTFFHFLKFSQKHFSLLMFSYALKYFRSS